MGSFIEINDTLRITKEQGFPLELDYGKHCAKTFTASDFSEKYLFLQINQLLECIKHLQYEIFS